MDARLLKLAERDRFTGSRTWAVPGSTVPCRLIPSAHTYRDWGPVFEWPMPERDKVAPLGVRLDWHLKLALQEARRILDQHRTKPSKVNRFVRLVLRGEHVDAKHDELISKRDRAALVRASKQGRIQGFRGYFLPNAVLRIDAK